MRPAPRPLRPAQLRAAPEGDGIVYREPLPGTRDDGHSGSSVPMPAASAKRPGEDCTDALRRIFGFDSFRGLQEDIVRHVAHGGDAFALMPTGAGKSACYQIPALVRPGTGVVVSPLVALMRNQIDRLRQSGVRAAALSSQVSASDQADVHRWLRDGSLDLLYVTPERFVTNHFRDTLAECAVSVVAVDEAHCVSQWGHDFRPEYLDVGTVARSLNDVPLIALTATADAQTRKDILNRLRLKDARQFEASFDRPNISYSIEPKKEPKRQLMDFLGRHRGQAGVVYCLSRNSVEQTAKFLSERGFRAVAYHAGLPDDQRSAAQDRFLNEDGIVCVATIAFGMGVDKPDVRFVAHMDLPKSIEAYYQETGRAGRDGDPAEAWMCFGIQDIVSHRRLIEQSEAPEVQKRVMRTKLNALVGLAESPECRRATVLRYFGEEHAGGCGRCDRCLTPPEVYDGTVNVQKLGSAVLRTGQRYGFGYLLDVLAGKATEKIVQNGHDLLPTFGVGRDVASDEWQSIARQAVAAGLLSVDPEKGSVGLTEAGRSVLKGAGSVRLIRERPAERSREKASGQPAPTKAGLPPERLALWEDLRSFRQEAARTQGVPPYVVFQDGTLAGIVQSMPSSPDELRKVSGMGEARIERYGEAILALVAARKPRNAVPDSIQVSF